MKPILKASLVVFAMLTANSSFAHKVNCFASADGKVISGYAWMSGGARPSNAPIEVLAPDGSVLYEGKTDNEGRFSFTPTRHCDHEIVVEAGEGHIARFTVPRDDLPPITLDADEPEPENTEPASSADSAWLERVVASAVSSQITPLRRELAQFRAQQRFQDIVAGIGYLAGITGIVFYFMAGKKQ